MEVEEQCSETEAAPAAVQQVVQGNKSEPIPIEVDSGIENMEVEEVRESSRIRVRIFSVRLLVKSAFIFIKDLEIF